MNWKNIPVKKLTLVRIAGRKSFQIELYFPKDCSIYFNFYAWIMQSFDVHKLVKLKSFSVTNWKVNLRRFDQLDCLWSHYSRDAIKVLSLLHSCQICTVTRTLISATMETFWWVACDIILTTKRILCNTWICSRSSIDHLYASSLS